MGFPEVAVLRAMSWLEVRGKIRTQALSPHTAYEAYLILKISNWAFGLDSMPIETSIEVGCQVSSNIAYLQYQMPKSRLRDEHAQIPTERQDGWLEIKLGEFLNGNRDEEVQMNFKEVKGYQLKGGLTIEGVEVRPKQ
ncbi:hypothetical protein Tsubulata_022720 [Turnera subulata]|uniref:F-box domain-containing protein n=1 Tax=Turnera subulata TaxID=218843 RepID=A0A9Q0IZ98_9ROSI|nr:hypothetical protein Tsubulata_022720 [Turnera subulata]